MKIGDSPLRREDARLLRGAGRYIDNLHADRMVEGVFIRSPMAHARIVSIDASEAIAGGALCVLTARDLPFNDRPWITRYWHPAIRNGLPRFLPPDRVRFVGEPVAFLVAGSRYEAEDLAERVNVVYEELPPVATTTQAQSDDAPLLHDEWPRNVAAAFSLSHGDAARALRSSDARVRRTFLFVRQCPLPLESRGILADYDEARQFLTVNMSTQAHYNVRQNLATILDLPEYQVRVVAEDVGGGFGAKSRTYAEEIVVSHASRVLRRPVKWIEDRFENLQATTHSRAIEVDLEIGASNDGTFTALSGRVTLDVGGYVFTSGVMTAEIAASHLFNGYKIANIAVDVRCVGTNKTPIATYRGAGMPEGIFPMECLVEVMAKELGLSALVVRERNVVRPADLPYSPGMVVAGIPINFESGDFPKVMKKAVEKAGYNETVETTANGERIAWGLACGIEGSGFVNFETANIRVDANGNVSVRSGMTQQGQGQLTTFAQVCADKLGVAFERVNVRMGDTDLMAFGRGAFASRGAIFGANAVAGAAEKLRTKTLECAGTLLQCDPGELTMTDGMIRKHGESQPALTIGDVARAVGPGGILFTGDVALEAQYVFQTDQPITYGMNVHIVRVKVDPQTGFYKLLDYVVGHDAGRALNPMIVEGQIVGGVVDGIGGAMFSGIEYDENGQLLTGSLADYLVATAPDLPRIRIAHVETRPQTNPLGVRGIGEGGIIPVAAAIANALNRAIDGIRNGHETPLFTLPLKPERVLAACDLARDRNF
jgi:aerobic carbon-monoxide dehydrogenase large subunit